MNRREFFTLLGLSPLAALSFGDISREPDILDFLDSGALGLKYKLLPVQRFILKMVYGLELEPHEQTYLARLQAEGRYTPAQSGSQESLIVMGRRAGMTLLGATMQLYEALKLLHGSESWPDGGIRQVLTLGYSKELSSLAYGHFTEALVGSKLRPHVQRNTMTFVDLLNDKRRVRATFRSGHARILRGIRASSGVFEDVAFWDEQNFHNCYTAVLPYMSRRTIFTSVSDDRWFREFYHARTEGPAMTLRIPSWEANPLMTRFLSERRSEDSFDREFGAKV